MLLFHRCQCKKKKTKGDGEKLVEKTGKAEVPQVIQLTFLFYGLENELWKLPNHKTQNTVRCPAGSFQFST